MIVRPWKWIGTGVLLLAFAATTAQAAKEVCPPGRTVSCVGASCETTESESGAVGVLSEGETPGGLTPVQSCGPGSKYLDASGKLVVLRLQGTFREMGRQYGALLRAEIRGMHEEIRAQYALNKIAIRGERLEAFSGRLFGLYPVRFKELAQGISEGAGIDRNTLAVNSEFLDYFLKHHFLPGTGKLQPAACSTLSAWGPYTRDGALVMGSNFDFPPWFKNFSPYLVVVVFNPADGSNPVALLTYAGQIGALQAFNKAGFILENNDGSSYGDMKRHFGKRVPFLAKLPQMAFDCASFPRLDAEMLSYRSHYPLVFSIAGPSRASVYEVATVGVKKREPEKEGILAGVNHYLNPSWPPLPTQNREAVDNSVLRQKNLLALAEKNKGEIDEARMMSILDVPISDGGATPPERNVYRFVADPELKRWWIKAPDYLDWTCIELDKLFK